MTREALTKINKKSIQLMSLLIASWHLTAFEIVHEKTGVSVEI